MSIATISTPALAQRWAEYRQQHPKSRIRNAADDLGVSEMELLVTQCTGQADAPVTRLRAEFADILKQVPTLDRVMALTRNNSVVHERKGPYLDVSINGTMGLVLGEDIDLPHLGQHPRQQHALALAFSVEELVMMGRYPRFGGQPGARDYHVVEAALAMVGMTSMAQRSYPTLSGGEQQRVQLARVLAQVWEAEPGYLLLDEPLTGLDLHHQHRTLAVARELVGKGFGVVAVLHDLNLAAQFADQVLLLHQGQPLAYGPPAQVLTAANILVGFELPVQLVPHPHHGCPLIVPCPTVNW